MYSVFALYAVAWFVIGVLATLTVIAIIVAFSDAREKRGTTKRIGNE